MRLRDTVLKMEAPVQPMYKQFYKIMKRQDHEDNKIQCLKRRANKIRTARIVENKDSCRNL